MEITGKNVAIAIFPVLITALASIADNSLRWRAEMEQKQFDRQTRILDKLMETSSAESRLAMANFYLGLGVFSGQYKAEIETAVSLAKEELEMAGAKAVAVADYERAVRQMSRAPASTVIEEPIALYPEAAIEFPHETMIEEAIAEAIPEPMPEPAPEPSDEVSPEVYAIQPPEVMAAPSPEGIKSIFSIDGPLF